MIDTNKIVIVIIFLICFSFINNLILTIDTLNEMTNDIDQEVFLSFVDPTIDVEKQHERRFKTIYEYIIYYLFYFDINDPKSVINIINY